MAAKAVASMATILGKENRSKIGKIGPVSKGLAVAGEFTGACLEGSGYVILWASPKTT